MKYLICTVSIVFSLLSIACTSKGQPKTEVSVGAENLDELLPLISGKKVALLVNHTSKVKNAHLLDTLLSHEVQVVKLFAPEHGFRGNRANGESVNNEKDEKTGLPIISLYGQNKKPSKTHLEGIDAVIYDIQDVGARFYTYISAMHYMMEACADNGVDFMVLDRPNPNGHYVDGPVLDTAFQSYVGMHPVPIIYGMTAGELAQMILGEKWLKTDKSLNLTVIKNRNWKHETKYTLPITPSPNLPNSQSIALYPSLCLFEGTNVSVGRGTSFPFQVIGVPDSLQGTFHFEPISISGVSQYPKYENERCFGLDLRNVEVPAKMDLSYLIRFYQQSKNKDDFFNSFFTKLAGTKKLQQQIEEGLSEDEIKMSWQKDLEQFKQTRQKYLLYD